MLTGRPNIHEPLIVIDEVDAEIGSQERKSESSHPKGRKRPLEPIDMKNEDLSPNVLQENFDFIANITTQTNNTIINNDKQLKSMIRARDVEIRRLTTLAREINQKLVLQMGYNDKIRDSKDAIIQKLEIKVTELQAFHSAIKSTFQPYEVLSLPVMMDKIKQFMELSVKMWPQGL
ncbi:hypothetical protein HDE_07927 [Halotydeus destructor]|nr:hypothetical protein HDE_07927 [Halotydeus destructor]